MSCDVMLRMLCNVMKCYVVHCNGMLCDKENVCFKCNFYCNLMRSNVKSKFLKACKGLITKL